MKFIIKRFDAPFNIGDIVDGIVAPNGRRMVAFDSSSILHFFDAGDFEVYMQPDLHPSPQTAFDLDKIPEGGSL